MDLTGVVGRFEETLGRHAMLAGEETAALAEALLGALRPAAERMALDLAEQAAVEVGAQLPDVAVEVRLRHGEPEMVVTRSGAGDELAAGELGARLTLRLPDALKQAVEAAAESAGQSINAFVVRALSTATRRATKGRRFTGTVRT